MGLFDIFKKSTDTRIDDKELSLIDSKRKYTSPSSSMFFEINATHDDEHCKVLDVMSKKYSNVDVDLTTEIISSGRNKGKMRYNIKYEGREIGNISVKKSEELKEVLKNVRYYKATLSLLYYDEHRHYSNLRFRKVKYKY